MSVIYDRKDYMDGKCSHDVYYRQFVNDSIVEFVRERIGEDVIRASTDPHLNDIKMIKWDALNQGIINRIDKKFFKKCNNVTYSEEDRNCFLWSLSSAVCIAKQAARIIKNEVLS